MRLDIVKLICDNDDLEKSLDDIVKGMHSDSGVSDSTIGMITSIRSTIRNYLDTKTEFTIDQLQDIIDDFIKILSFIIECNDNISDSAVSERNAPSMKYVHWLSSVLRKWRYETEDYISLIRKSPENVD